MRNGLIGGLLTLATCAAPATFAAADGKPLAETIQMSDSDQILPIPDDDAIDSTPVKNGKSALVAFDTAPFPYHGTIPADDNSDQRPFLDVRDGQRRGHTSTRGGIYWEDETYSDRRSLLYIPPGFDSKKPAVIIVFFHGNGALLSRDVIDRQLVPRQLADSNLNAVLVAPQFASDALDSSAGAFWQPGAFARYLKEAAERLAKLQDDGTPRSVFAKMPVVLVAYSGGYLPAAAALEVGGVDARLRGVALLDALYDNSDTFADWVADHQDSAFFFSAYSSSSAAGNGALQDLLLKQGLDFSEIPPHCLHAGDVVFLDTGNRAAHNDFLTQAWTGNPLTWLFDRIPGFPRAKESKPATTCKH